jgi:endonuclease YncB( thermonuclease family)
MPAAPRRLTLAALSLAACAGDAGPLAQNDAAPEDVAAADVAAPADEGLAPLSDIDLSLPDSGGGDKFLRHGAKAWVGHVTDGDTLTVWIGETAPARYIVRMVGLAAPECFKDVRATPDGNGQSCVRDDELDGLGAFEALRDLAEGKQVTLTCEAGPGELCPTDPFGRSLAYVEVDGKDAATEMARMGHGFSYVVFPSSKRADICAAVYAARDARRGMWALGSEQQVLAGMNDDTRSWYWGMHDSRCDAAMRR